MTSEDTAAPASAEHGPSLVMRGQFIKDLSFENPRAPASLMEVKEAPQIDVNVDLNAERLTDTLFELGITIHIRAVAEKQTLFICDLTYSGLFELVGLSEEQLQPVLFVDCAFLLFPFARRVIADCTRDGGFPPLLMEPVDFAGLYRQNQGNIQTAKKEDGAEA